MKKKIIAFLATILIVSTAFGEELQLISPNKNIKINITISEKITWSVKCGNEIILQPSQLAMLLNNKLALGFSPKLIKKVLSQHNNTLIADIPVKSKEILNNYNELVLDFKGNYRLYFRAYDDGVAYRFETTLKNEENYKLCIHCFVVF